MEVISWVTPWPMVQTSEFEWIVIRDDPARPVAVVREIPARRDARYRIVRWAPRSEDRRLFEYVRTLAQADMAVTFTGAEPDSGINHFATERSPEWGRFERWFWSQTSERMLLEMRPAWLTNRTAAKTRAPRDTITPGSR